MTTTNEIQSILKEIYGRRRAAHEIRVQDRIAWPDKFNKPMNKSTRPKDSDLQQAARTRLMRK